MGPNALIGMGCVARGRLPRSRVGRLRKWTQVRGNLSETVRSWSGKTDRLGLASKGDGIKIISLVEKLDVAGVLRPHTAKPS